MPLRLLIVALSPLLAGYLPDDVRGSGVPSADAPFTLTALDAGQATFPIRWSGVRGSPIEVLV